MSDLKPPRSFSVTLAGVLAILTGGIWLALSISMLIWGSGPEDGYPGLGAKELLAVIVTCCLSVATLIGGFGVLVRRNWGRALAMVLVGAWVLFGVWSLRPFSWIHADSADLEYQAPFILPLLASITWFVLLIGKRVRAEFLPPSEVQIYVNMLNNGTPCSKPVRALALGNGLFEILPTEGYAPDNERWEFHPGSIVRGREEHRDGEDYLLATSLSP